MKISDKTQRLVSFYLSVALFFLLLPIVISYSLGYKVDFHTLKIYKTGIIYLKSQPSGASIYINGRMLADITPARVEELKPGTYNVGVMRDGFYPWQKEIVVRPNMVTKADDIVLFPLNQDMRKISDYEVKDFVVSDKNLIYYMTSNGLFKSNMDGSGLKKLSRHSKWPENIIGRKFSPDGDKFLYFTKDCIWVAHLNMDRTSLVKSGESAKIEEILKIPNEIIDAFWYSESKHIVFITDKDINVLEVNGEGTRNIVTLYKFNARPQGLYYDKAGDSLYFTDVIKSPDSKEGMRLYRLELRQKFFDQLMRRLKKEFEIDIQYERQR